MKKILNLTQHQATAQQSAAGVIEPHNKAAIQAALTFDGLPNQAGLAARADQLVRLAVAAIGGDEWYDPASDTRPLAGRSIMIGGAPYLMPPLQAALQAAGATVVYAFSTRESVDRVQPDGSTRKVAVFRHAGFVQAGGGA